MADPRFFQNLGPFTLAQICEKAGIGLPAGADASRSFSDLADLSGAGPQHLAFFSGASVLREAFAASQAGACLVPPLSSIKGGKRPEAPAGMVVLETPSVAQAFATIAALFYPLHSQPRWNQTDAISPQARIGKEVEIAPGVVIAPGAEIGDRTRLAPGVVIGPGVAIGRDCEIGALVT